MSQPRDAAALRPAGQPAGVWRRAVALGVDLVIVRLLLVVGSFVATRFAALDLVARAFEYSYALVVPAAYFVLMHGAAGQTLGKRICGVRVVETSGRDIGYARALGRLAGTVLSAVPCGAGFGLAAVRRDKRALHDLLAGTRVVRVPPRGRSALLS
ncbi:MAG: RDD family protein [Candidatus Rokuibacteriota bacterium]